MKTKNLTPWCNLFLTASKYKVTINQSRHQFLIYGVFICLVIATLLIFFTLNLYAIASVTFVAFFIFSIVMSNPRIYSPLANSSCKEFLFLTKEGSFQLDNSQRNHIIEKFILYPNSRVSFLGCWLVFYEEGNINKLQSKFIFKDSLSSKDYSRLRCIITALK